MTRKSYNGSVQLFFVSFRGYLKDATTLKQIVINHILSIFVSTDLEVM